MQTVRIDIDQTMQAIVKTKDLMVELYNQGKVIQCQRYELPLVTREDENERPEYIHVQTNSDIDNADSLLREVNRWYAREDTHNNHLSTKASQRVPGFIQMQMNNRLFSEFEMVTQHLNELKKQFKFHVTSIKHADTRFEILHKMYPMLITTNLYRKVKLFRNPSDIKFYWANKPRIEKVDYSRTIKRLERSKLKPNNISIDCELWREKVEHEITLLKSVNDKSLLRTVRDSKVQPMVNVDGFQTSCPTPILLVSQNDEPIEVEPLTDYDADKQRKGTGRKAKEYVQLIPRLSLYQSM